MSDDQEQEPTQYDFTHEQATEALEWAANTAAYVLLMYYDPNEDAETKLDNYETAVADMFESVPDCLQDPAMEIAKHTLDEEEVKRFKEELEEL